MGQGNRTEARRLAMEAARLDPQAFGTLYDRYVRQIYRYLLSRTCNEAEAQDLTAQTFIKAFENFSQYRLMVTLRHGCSGLHAANT